MEALPEGLGGLSALTHLSIETSSLSHLPASIGNLASLRELIFSYCHCLQVIHRVTGRERAADVGIALHCWKDGQCALHMGQSGVPACTWMMHSARTE